MAGYYKYLLIFLFALYINCARQEKIKLQCVFVANGKASWYGPGFQGKTTASGDTFDMNRYTAAHKWLEFGTLVRVTNLKNGRDVVVEINDRGPWSKQRLIDLSKSAADEIDLVKSGVADVEIEIAGYTEVEIKTLIKHYNNLLTTKLNN